MKADSPFIDTRILTKKSDPNSLKLDNGSRIGVIGGGPSGSFFSYFLLDIAQRAGLDIHVDIYEPRDFFRPVRLAVICVVA